MNKEELKQLIKEELLKEFAAYRLYDSEQFKSFQNQFYYIVTDLNSRKIKKHEALQQMKTLTEKFGLYCAEWGEDETYDEIEFIQDLAKQGEEYRKKNPNK